MKRFIVVPILMFSLLHGWSVVAEEPVAAGEATSDTLVLSLTQANIPWTVSVVTDELVKRAANNSNGLEVDKKTANTLAKSLVEAANPQNTLRSRNVALLRSNGCSSRYKPCGQVMELIAQNRGLEPHQEASVSAAALGIWEQGGSLSKRGRRAETANIVTTFLKLLNTANERQPLTSSSFSNLIEMALDHTGTRHKEDIELVLDILETALIRNQLSNEQRLQLVEGLAVGKQSARASLFASFYIDEVNRHEGSAREERIAFWLRHKNRSIRNLIVESLEELAGRERAKYILMEEARNPKAGRNVCTALGGLMRNAVLTDGELMTFVNRMITKENGCQFVWKSVTRREVSRRQENKERVPADVVSVLSAEIIEFSMTLPDEQVAWVTMIIGIMDDLESVALSEETLSNVTTWFASYGEGSKIVDRAVKAGQLGESRMLDIMDLAFDYSVYENQIRRNTSIVNVYADNPYSASFYDDLAERRKVQPDVNRSDLSLRILYQVYKQRGLENSPKAAALLLLNAEEFRFSRDLVRLFEQNTTNEVLTGLAMSISKTDFALQKAGLDLLTTAELPDEALMHLAPVMSSGDPLNADFVAEYFCRQFGDGPSGADWLISTFSNESQPFVLRKKSIQKLSGPFLRPAAERFDEHAVPKIRQALIEHVESGSSSLRMEALKGLRSPIELDRDWLFALTEDSDAAVAQEAVLQMQGRFDEGVPFYKKFQLPPTRGFSKAVDKLAFTVALIMGFVSIVLSGITAVVVLTVGLGIGTSKSVVAGILAAISSALVGVGIWVFGFLAVIVLGMSHGSSSSNPDWVVSLVGIVVFAAYWFLIFRVAKHVYRITKEDEAGTART